MKVIINLTEEQFLEIEEAADLVGLDKGVYLGKAVELMNQLAKRKGAELFVREKDGKAAYIIEIPGITK